MPARVGFHYRLGAPLTIVHAGNESPLCSPRCSCKPARPALIFFEGDLLRRRTDIEQQLRNRSSGSGVLRSKCLHQIRRFADIAQQNRAQPGVPSRNDQLLVGALLGLGELPQPRRSHPPGSVMPMDATSTPITLSLVAILEPR